MAIIVGSFFVLLSLIFYALNQKFTAPTVLISISWGFTLIMYGSINHGMSSLSYTVLFIIFLWAISLLCGVGVFNYHKKNKVNIKQRVKFFTESHDIENNFVIKKNLNVYFWISVICFFPQVFISYKQAISGGENIFLNMRLASAGLIESEYSVGVFGYGKTFTIVALLVQLLVYKAGQSKIRIYILFFMYFVLSVLAVGKSQFLFLIISSFLVWSFTKKISKKTIIAGFVFLIMIFSLLQLARSNDTEDKDNVVSGMFYTYMFGGLPALDQIVNSEMKSTQFGQNSLQFFYRFKNSIWKEDDQKEGYYVNDVSYEGYFFVPDPTNVNTVIGPFWLDFRYFGVIIFGFIYGILFGFLYMKALKMNIYGIITYCLFVSSLILPFFGEFIFAYLSYFIQVFLLSYFVDKSFLKFFSLSNNSNKKCLT